MRVHALMTPQDGSLNANRVTMNPGVSACDEVYATISNSALTVLEYAISVGNTALWNYVTSLPGNHKISNPAKELKEKEELKELLTLLPDYEEIPPTNPPPN